MSPRRAARRALLARTTRTSSTYTTYVGQGSPRFWLGLNPQLPNEAFAEIVIVSRTWRRASVSRRGSRRRGQRRTVGSARARRPLQFRPAGRLPGPVPRVGPDTRPCATSPIRCASVMRPMTRCVDPQLDWNEQTPYLKLAVDQDRARALGLTPQDISQSLADADLRRARSRPVRDGIEKVGVVARAVPSERLDLGRMSAISLTIYDVAQRRAGAAVAGRQDRIRAHEEPILWRRNRDMAITVRADVVDGVQAPDVTTRDLAAAAGHGASASCRRLPHRDRRRGRGKRPRPMPRSRPSRR
jgi:multidrug efflux pump